MQATQQSAQAPAANTLVSPKPGPDAVTEEDLRTVLVVALRKMNEPAPEKPMDTRMRAIERSLG